MTSFSKKKDKEISGPLASAPGFRTPDFIKQKQSMFGGKVGGGFNKANTKFSAGTFKTQHKG